VRSRGTAGQSLLVTFATTVVVVIVILFFVVRLFSKRNPSKFLVGSYECPSTPMLQFLAMQRRGTAERAANPISAS
jgi:hypothetical protein